MGGTANVVPPVHYRNKKTKNSGCYTGVLCFGEIYMKIEDSNLICQLVCFSVSSLTVVI